LGRDSCSAVEEQVLAVLEAATGEDDRQIGGDMGVGIAEVAAVEHHGAVEQGAEPSLAPFKPA